MSYVRAMKRDTGKVRAIGRVIHPGGKIATAEGSLVDAAGELYAHEGCAHGHRLGAAA